MICIITVIALGEKRQKTNFTNLTNQLSLMPPIFFNPTPTPKHKGPGLLREAQGPQILIYSLHTFHRPET